MRKIFMAVDLNDICALDGTIYENLLYMRQKELHQKLKELVKDIEQHWVYYNESGQRTGTCQERIDPDPAYLYNCSLEETVVICSVLRYKCINEQRRIHQALCPDEMQALQLQLFTKVKSSPKITYIELLNTFPNQEIEIILEDLIEKQKLKRIGVDYKNKGKWRI